MSYANNTSDVKPAVVQLGAPNAVARPTVRITAARYVVSWRWDVGGGDVCGICRNYFEACCPKCTMPGDDCPPLLGACNHAFHLHCIMSWLTALADKAEKECPLCRRPWEEK